MVLVYVYSLSIFSLLTAPADVINNSVMKILYKLMRFRGTYV